MDLKFLCFEFLLFFINLPGGYSRENSQVACKDEEGKTVDWFYLYKLPKHYSSSKAIDIDNSGLNYLYVTSRSYDNWQLSIHKINESSSMPAQTLDPLAKNPLALLLAYNDEYPNGTVIFHGGHTKGVVATDDQHGLWLIHSVPKFPSLPSYEYPSSGAHYGQSFLCISFNASEMDKVGQQLLYNEPNIYYNRVPMLLANKFPLLEKAINREWITQEPFKNIMDLISLEGVSFKSFAKSSKFNQELYEDFVAPTLDTHLMVETWRNGAGNFQSNCSRNDNVYNVEELQNVDFNLDFKTSADHSKWAVSQSVGLKFWRWRFPITSNWICVGDINRQQHQLVRGGGTVCQRHSKIAKLYRNMVKQYEGCKK